MQNLLISFRFKTFTPEFFVSGFRYPLLTQATIFSFYCFPYSCTMLRTKKKKWHESSPKYFCYVKSVIDINKTEKNKITLQVTFKPAIFPFHAVHHTIPELLKVDSVEPRCSTVKFGLPWPISRKCLMYNAKQKFMQIHQTTLSHFSRQKLKVTGNKFFMQYFILLHIIQNKSSFIYRRRYYGLHC